MNKPILDPNLFTPLEHIDEFDLVIGMPFKRTFYFLYNNPDNRYYGKLSGNPETSGVNTYNLIHEPNGNFSMTVYGRPKRIGKNILTMTLGNKNSYIEFPVVFHVSPLKFLDFTLPTAYGLRKQYKTQIHFYNPSSLKPKFSYNFPVEFGAVKTEIADALDFTTISFYPSKAGKYKFYVEALGEILENGSIENIVLGGRTLHLEVVDTDPKPTAPGPVSVKAVEMRDWQ